MSNWIKSDTKNQGIVINDTHIQINVYAEDATFYVKDIHSLSRNIYIQCTWNIEKIFRVKYKS